MAGYIDLHVHCMPRDGNVRFRGWRRLAGGTAWCRERPAFNRLRQKLNPFERMVVLLDELEIRPPGDGFAALLNRLGQSSSEG